MSISPEEFERISIEESDYLAKKIINLIDDYAREHTIELIPASAIIVESMRKANDCVVAGAIIPGREDIGRRYLAGLDPYGVE